MNKITPFLWFNDNAEDAAEFYLSVFPEAKAPERQTPIPTSDTPAAIAEIIEAAMFKNVFCPDRQAGLS